MPCLPVPQLFLIPKTNYCAPGFVLPYLLDVEKTATMNWAKLVHSKLLKNMAFLQTQVQKRRSGEQHQKTLYVTGCVMCLIVWILELTKIASPRFIDSRPRIKKWAAPLKRVKNLSDLDPSQVSNQIEYEVRENWQEMKLQEEVSFYLASRCIKIPQQTRAIPTTSQGKEQEASSKKENERIDNQILERLKALESQVEELKSNNITAERIYLLEEENKCLRQYVMKLEEENKMLRVDSKGEAKDDVSLPSSSKLDFSKIFETLQTGSPERVAAFNLTPKIPSPQGSESNVLKATTIKIRETQTAYKVEDKKGETKKIASEEEKETIVEEALRQSLSKMFHTKKLTLEKKKQDDNPRKGNSTTSIEENLEEKILGTLDSTARNREHTQEAGFFKSENEKGKSIPKEVSQESVVGKAEKEKGQLKANEDTEIKEEKRDILEDTNIKEYNQLKKTQKKKTQPSKGEERKVGSIAENVKIRRAPNVKGSSFIGYERFNPKVREDVKEFIESIEDVSRREWRFGEETWASGKDLNKLLFRDKMIDGQVLDCFVDMLRKTTTKKKQNLLKWHCLRSYVADYNKLTLPKDKKDLNVPKEIMDMVDKLPKLFGIKQEDFEDMDSIFTFLNKDLHWHLLEVSFKDKVFRSYNSLPTDERQKTEILRWVAWLQEFFGGAAGKGSQISQWEIEYMDCPRQEWGEVDCGVFVMKYLDCVINGKEMQFTREDIPNIRAEMFDRLMQFGKLEVVKESQEDEDIEIIGYINKQNAQHSLFASLDSWLSSKDKKHEV